MRISWICTLCLLLAPVVNAASLSKPGIQAGHAAQDIVLVGKKKKVATPPPPPPPPTIDGESNDSDHKDWTF